MGQLNSQDLYRALWASADEMRKVMSAEVYKDYLLGLTFYKYLSDKQLYDVVDLLEDRKPADLDEAQSVYEQVNGEEQDDLKEELEDKYGYAIPPQYTFTAFYHRINDHTFMLSDLRQAFRDIEQSQGGAYEGLFDDFDITSKDLGSTPEKRNGMISAVMKKMAAIDFTGYGTDALGDAYEYLIAQFASESGKKAGEFYTPQSVAKVISRIIAYGRERKEALTMYDPTCGSGSLLLQIRNFMHKGTDGDYTRHIHYFGQEINHQTYNLARMNMMLHQIPVTYQHLRNGDTLDEDWPTDEPTTFDGVAMNPPYSLPWSAKESFLQDPRFASYEKLAPKNKADFAFLLHGFYHLKHDGTMGIVLPHGVLFRGGAEGTIRKHLLEMGSIYAVIGLPAGIFYNTSIPTCVIILKKNNTERSVFFIDASKEFKKERAQNFLTDDNVDKIVQTYIARANVDKYAHLAPYEEIVENEFNLNIPRYVDTFEPEPEVDLNAAFATLHQVEQEERVVDKTLQRFFRELGLDTKDGE